ncbi:hypothetical protein ACHAXA_002896 [Cyclostephanos tholiformis]|uniref:Thioredoxin domain-containing protein n=1 Tax=Cyclostephanos tholiformis TaxID=382380 RepID=A0ABD3SGS7_9STRA
MTSRTSIVGAALGTLIVALRCGTSPSDAFLIDVNNNSHLSHDASRRRSMTIVTTKTTTTTTTTTTIATTSRGVGRRPSIPPVPSADGIAYSSSSSSFSSSSSRSSSSSKTCLFMIAKSGGRLILSADQFEREVLLSTSMGGEDGGMGRHRRRSSDVGSMDEDVVVVVDDDDVDDMPALVLFTAPWCGPCRLTSPVVREILDQYRGRIRVLEISTDDLPDVAMDAGVRSIPTILIYHDGEVRDTIVGCVARNVLARAVDKVLEDIGRL